MDNSATTNNVFEQLTSTLNAANMPYRLMEHEPAGPTDLASKIRGNQLRQAAKAMVLMAKRGKERLFVLAIVGGDRRIDMKAVGARLHATYVGLAPAEKAAELTGCVMGSVPPFSFHPELAVMADRRLLDNEQIVFNAGRLDASIFLSARDYTSVANPIVADISMEEPSR